MSTNCILQDVDGMSMVFPPSVDQESIEDIHQGYRSAFDLGWFKYTRFISILFYSFFVIEVSSTDEGECSTKRKFNEDMSKIRIYSENHSSIVPDVPWQMPVVMDTSSMAMSPV